MWVGCLSENFLNFLRIQIKISNVINSQMKFNTKYESIAVINTKTNIYSLCYKF